MGLKRRLGIATLLLAGLSAFDSKLSWCYPEMVRHGYPNCTSCHVNPYGGGVLTQYGRELSRAVLSTWGTESESEAKFAYGAIRPPEWLDVQGFYRGVYVYRNTPFVQSGQYISMQQDLEASAHFGQWYVDAMAGYQDPTGASSLADHFISRRHYVNFRPTDQLSFRAGRFLPALGINTPDHIIPTRKGLGWDEGQETYNLEAAWIGDAWNLYATLDLGRPDQPSLNHETGAALTPSLAFADHHKVGLSYFYGDGPAQRRHVFGPWGILGFTPRLFLLSEWDLQRISTKSEGAPGQWGAVNYQRLDYEVLQGLHAYLTQDFSELDFNDPRTLQNSYGVGVQFFPLPHFEINVSWQKQRTMAADPGYSDYAWLMANFYL